jgi:hypothetical protein
MMPAYITGIIWVSSFFPVKWIRYQVLVSLVIHLALAFEIIFYPFQVKSDDTWYGWEDLAKEVKNIQTKHRVHLFSLQTVIKHLLYLIFISMKKFTIPM